MLELVLSVDLITAILVVDKVALQRNLMGANWSAVADLFAHKDYVTTIEDMSGQGSVSQATPGALASGVVETSLISQVLWRAPGYGLEI